MFDPLPEKFKDSAFLDRLHFYIPGWEVDIIRGEMFSRDYGFVVDYLAEILRHLRNQDYSDQYKQFFTLSSDISSRDQDGINKTFSGLMKILYPHGGETKDVVEKILKIAIEGRRRVKDQLFRIDTTYPAVNFSYFDKEGNSKAVATLEQLEYPRYFHQVVGTESGDIPTDAGYWVPTDESKVQTKPSTLLAEQPLEEKHVTIMENQRGVSYDTLFGQYLKGVKHLTITDPYIRIFYQVRNLMEFLENDSTR